MASSPSCSEVMEEPQRSPVKDADGWGKYPKWFFRHPTAEEMSRLTREKSCDSGLYAQEARNQFARLLNRGSSLE